jgi:putative FmdB family regulatory protein
MPTYVFQCKKCNKVYEELTKWDKMGKYKDVCCPDCGSKKKNQLPTCANFQFSNPVGTDRWNSDSTGHDYRFKYNIPKVKKEREMAQALSHMGANPYDDTSQADIQLDTGIHDAEVRPGLS